jgi:hypothetical protein
MNQQQQLLLLEHEVAPGRCRLLLLTPAFAQLSPAEACCCLWRPELKLQLVLLPFQHHQHQPLRQPLLLVVLLLVEAGSGYLACCSLLPLPPGPAASLERVAAAS